MSQMNLKNNRPPPSLQLPRPRRREPVLDGCDVGEKAVAQVKQGAVELLTPRLDRLAAETIADKLTGGYWTHDYALTAAEAKALGLPVKVGMPVQVMESRSQFNNPASSTSP